MAQASKEAPYLTRWIFSVLIWGFGSALTIVLWGVMLFLTIVLYPFDRSRRIVHAQCFWWSAILTRVIPYWNVTVEGLEHIDPKRTYVVIVNHQSLADIIVLYRTKMQFKWVAKESLFKVPFIGWNLGLAKHICLERGNMGSIKKVYREAAGWIKSGMSVLFFPEGTRSETNTMNEFQNGAFKLALRERVPVLPIALSGTRDAIPKGSWVFNHRVDCFVRVLPPIETTEFRIDEFDRLKDLARHELEKALTPR